MAVIYLLLLLIGAVCLVLSALNVRVGEQRTIDLTALGLFFWILVPLIQMFDRVIN